LSWQGGERGGAEVEAAHLGGGGAAGGAGVMMLIKTFGGGVVGEMLSLILLLQAIVPHPPLQLLPPASEQLPDSLLVHLAPSTLKTVADPGITWNTTVAAETTPLLSLAVAPI